jgi:hypothetical protein
MMSGEENAQSPKQGEFYVIGKKMSKCDICKATKETTLLSYGLSLCEDCRATCAMILEQFQAAQTNGSPKSKIGKKEAGK